MTTIPYSFGLLFDNIDFYQEIFECSNFYKIPFEEAEENLKFFKELSK